jgi:carbonic anhydrase
MRFPTAIFVAMLATGASATGVSHWLAVVTAGGERVEIDRGRLMRTAPGRVLAWSRLVLGRELTDASGSYTSVQAMNRYDCEARTFATLKRVYFDGDKAVREESIGSPQEIVAGSGSVEDRLLTAACDPVDRMRQAAAAVADPGTAALAGKPGVMYADMRTADAGGEPARAKTMPVADVGQPELKPGVESRPKSAAETRIEIRSPSERPRFIDLPRKDPAAPAAADASAVPAGPAASAPPAAKGTGDAKRVTDVKELARSVEAAMANAQSRHERERTLATSGPRRAAAVPRPRVEPVPFAVVEHREIPWSYEGEGGPASWGRLRSDYGLCATGKRQSPIDIREGIRVDLEPIRFDYRPTQFRIVDTGHTIQVNVGEGSTMSVMGRAYRLTEFHFHRPAEERVNGKAFDMVIHFSHRDDQGKLAMIAVLLEKGAEHPLIQTLWNNMPLEVNQEVAPAEILDLNKLLPEDRSYYTYMGSLTMPPCTEDVLWMVFKQPVKVSEDQIAIFSRLYRNNARPVQPANGRLVKENR